MSSALVFPYKDNTVADIVAPEVKEEVSKHIMERPINVQLFEPKPAICTASVSATSWVVPAPDTNAAQLSPVALSLLTLPDTGLPAVGFG
ncbi:MAG: hypothetical protein WC479_12635 [Candidatus Izemoplasmatales bacterium]